MCLLSEDNRFIVCSSLDLNVPQIKIFSFWSEYEISYGLPHNLISNDIYYIFALDSGEIKVFDYKTEQFLKTLTGHTETPTYIQFTSTPNLIITASTDKTIKVWDINLGECIKTFVETEIYLEISCILQNKFLFSSAGTDIKIWDFASGECIKLLQGHSLNINSYAITNDTAYVISSGADTVIKIWSLENGQCIKTIKKSHESSRVLISKDNKFFVYCSEDSNIRICDFPTGNVIKTIPYNTESSPFALAPSGKFLLTTEYKCVKLWNLDTLQCTKTIIVLFPN